MQGFVYIFVYTEVWLIFNFLACKGTLWHSPSRGSYDSMWHSCISQHIKFVIFLVVMIVRQLFLHCLLNLESGEHTTLIYELCSRESQCRGDLEVYAVNKYWCCARIFILPFWVMQMLVISLCIAFCCFENNLARQFRKERDELLVYTWNKIS